MSTTAIEAPYLIFLGDVDQWVNAKTGQGLVDWCPDKCVAQYRLPGCTIDLGIPDMTIAEAKEAGVRSMVIGIAPVGGNIKEEWIGIFADALQAGIHVVNGLHTRLLDYPTIRRAAEVSPARVIQVRTAPKELSVGTGRQRTGKRVLMVGTDCGVGKKYSALSLHRAMQARGINATFRATGQTGIMISGAGIPMDAVITDFISGAAEALSPDNDPDHWDVIEGQGALHHPGYAAVSLGILHGSQPDAIVLCHEATREVVDGFPGYFVGSIAQRIDEALSYGRLTSPAIYCAGISVNTARLATGQRAPFLRDLSRETGLPCVDPMRGSLDPIIDRLLNPPQ